MVTRVSRCHQSISNVKIAQIVSKHGRFSNECRIPKGIIHGQVRFNNTIVIVIDVRGQVVSWCSMSTCGFRGTRRGTPFATQTATTNAIRTVVDQGMQPVVVIIKGPGLGRNAALRAIGKRGVLLSFVLHVTRMPHNECRP
ncbi:hypothetical protein AMTRI_Chr01g128270 [Amborella trichopoda]